MEYLSYFLIILISGSVCYLIVLTRHFHGNWTNDDFHGVQKIHHNPTPRIGGLSIIISIFSYYLIFHAKDEPLYLLILISSIPIIVSGFLEDITKKIKPSLRFICSITSGIIFIYLIKYLLHQLNNRD